MPLHRLRTNRDILLKYFWEHAQFGWVSQEFMYNRSEGFRGYRDRRST